jgi:hypothetical protein
MNEHQLLVFRTIWSYRAWEGLSTVNSGRSSPHVAHDVQQRGRGRPFEILFSGDAAVVAATDRLDPDVDHLIDLVND